MSYGVHEYAGGGERALQPNFGFLQESPLLDGPTLSTSKPIAATRLSLSGALAETSKMNIRVRIASVNRIIRKECPVCVRVGACV